MSTATRSRLDALVRAHPLPTWRPVAWAVMIMLAVALAWANFAKLDEVAVAPGEVIPQGKVKVIQHLEGGIIEQIFVAEGDTINNGAPLVQLDLATGAVNQEELQVRLDGLILTRARLEAEANATELAFPEEVAARRPQIVGAETRAFQARREELDETLQVLHEQAKQRELEVQELEAKLRATDKNLRLARERLRLSKSLLSQGLVPRMEHLELEAEVDSLDGDLESLTPQIPRARAAVAEAEGRMREERTRFRREAHEQLGRVEQELARVRELLGRANEQDVRALIRSPIEGIVKNMRYNTIGGVVRPGEAIMEIVPSGENLVVEARLNPTDRGYVTEGQRATVKISTYDYARYGGLDGDVIHVAPDSTTSDEGEPFFRVVVKTDRTYLGDVAGKLPITPGMQATVDIHTGEKSVMDYLVKPVLKLRHEAFRER